MTITVNKIADAVSELPALSTVVSKVLKITEDPGANASNLAEAIVLDPNLAASILKLANSAYYGFARHISTVSDAIVLLGFSTIRSLTVAASTYRIYDKEITGYALSKGDIWRHCLSCAMMSKLIALKTRYKVPEEAYIAGLLHDVGKIILGRFVEQDYEKIMSQVEAGKSTFSVAEKEILGFDHPTVGAKVAEKWLFPENLVDAIRYHHDPERSKKNSQLTDIVHIADATCLMMGIGLGGDGLAYEFDQKALDRLGLSEPDMENLMSRLGDLLVDPQCFGSFEDGGV